MKRVSFLPLSRPCGATGPVRAFPAGELGADDVFKWYLAVPAVAITVAVTAVAKPQWVEAVGADVWNLPALHAKIDEAEERSRELGADGEEVRHRIAVKETIIADVLDGRCDLAAATARFTELNASHPDCMSVIRSSYPGDTDEEKLARNVISYCESRVPAAQRPALTARLTAELDFMLLCR